MAVCLCVFILAISIALALFTYTSFSIWRAARNTFRCIDIRESYHLCLVPRVLFRNVQLVCLEGEVKRNTCHLWLLYRNVRPNRRRADALSRYACHSKHFFWLLPLQLHGFCCCCCCIALFSTSFSLLFHFFFCFWSCMFSANRFMISCRQLPPVEINYIQFSIVPSLRLLLYVCPTHTNTLFLTPKLHSHLNTTSKMLSTRHQLCSQSCAAFFFFCNIFCFFFLFKFESLKQSFNSFILTTSAAHKHKIQFTYSFSIRFNLNIDGKFPLEIQLMNTTVLSIRFTYN